jgi:hypothetical protein
MPHPPRPQPPYADAGAAINASESSAIAAIEILYTVFISSLPTVPQIWPNRDKRCQLKKTFRGLYMAKYSKMCS